MAETEYFAAGTVPTEYCDHHVSATICSASGLLANEFCPEETRHSGIYIVGGSENTDDGQYLLPAALAQDNYCTVHTAATIIPEIPEIPEIHMPGESPGDTGDDGDKEDDDDNSTDDNNKNDNDNRDTPDQEDKKDREG